MIPKPDKEENYLLLTLMSAMQKFPIKYLHSEFKNTVKKFIHILKSDISQRSSKDWKYIN